MTGVAVAVVLSLFGTRPVEFEQSVKPNALLTGEGVMAAADYPYAPARAAPVRVAQGRVAPAYVAPVPVAPTRAAPIHLASAPVAPLRFEPVHVVPPSLGIALIIHVPQHEDRNRYTDFDRREAPATAYPADDEPLPPPRHRSKPRWPARADEPTAAPRHTSAPPHFDDGPTPIHPTPRFVRKIDPSRNAVGPLPAPAD
jgi:hypothetical protein